MWYDAVVLAVLVLATLRGAARGFVWQLASIAALILCFAFAESGSALIAPHIALEPPLNRWVTMFVLYIVCSFASFAAARLLYGWIEKAKFVEFDRHLGSLFGFVKGLVFSLVLTFFVVTLSEAVRDHVLASRSGYAAAIIMNRLHPVMPAELHEVLDPYIHQLDRPDLKLLHARREAAGDNHTNASEGEGGIRGDGPTVKSLEELLAKVPGLADRELKQRVLTALQTMSAADQQRLLDMLRQGVPDTLRTLAAAGDQPGVIPAAGSRPGEAGHTQEALVREIAAVYADDPARRAEKRAEIESALDGLPERIALAVLEDWRADLLLLKPDPEPSTDVATSLDARIVYQLRQAGVAAESLSRGLRERPEGVSR